MSKPVFEFSKSIILWYQKNHRQLPWRETRDPYKVWLSEIILQQTRVEQGMPYYYRFLERFPTLADFSQATEDEILKLWQGLGYYSRARNMMHTAREVMDRYHGRFPGNYKDLISLKGIGPYTAAAISSFSFDLAHAVVDGNVIRLISRVFGVTDDPGTSGGKAVFADKANRLLDRKRPGLFNQAVMEFGALQCRPSRPGCGTCPLSVHCVAFATGRVEQLPVKTAKKEVKTRYFNYLLLRNSAGIWIRKRPEGDIWAGLYEFPMLETARETDVLRLRGDSGWKNLFGNRQPRIHAVSGIIRHRLSHQLIIGRMFEVEIARNLSAARVPGCIQVAEKLFQKYPVPRLVEKLADELLHKGGRKAVRRKL